MEAEPFGKTLEVISNNRQVQILAFPCSLSPLPGDEDELRDVVHVCGILPNYLGLVVAKEEASLCSVHLDGLSGHVGIHHWATHEEVNLFI